MIWPWILGGAWAAHALVPALSARTANITHTVANDVSLTFDDGPDPVYTPQVLEILAAAGVPATFFLVGRKAERHPGLVREIVAAGHAVGNHSYAHIPPWFQPPVHSYRDHMRTNHIIADAIGRIPAYARAPWGFPNAGGWLAARRSRQRYVHWTVHAYDWKPGITAVEIRSSVARQVTPGGIILLHDGTGYPGDPTPMIQALPDILCELKGRYRVVPLCGAP